MLSDNGSCVCIIVNVTHSQPAANAFHSTKVANFGNLIKKVDLEGWFGRQDGRKASSPVNAIYSSIPHVALAFLLSQRIHTLQASLRMCNTSPMPKGMFALSSNKCTRTALGIRLNSKYFALPLTSLSTGNTPSHGDALKHIGITLIAFSLRCLSFPFYSTRSHVLYHNGSIVDCSPACAAMS